jgi:hypothetical protein
MSDVRQPQVETGIFFLIKENFDSDGTILPKKNPYGFKGSM